MFLSPISCNWSSTEIVEMGAEARRQAIFSADVAKVYANAENDEAGAVYIPVLTAECQLIAESMSYIPWSR